ncbi:MAG: hypothetical protein LBT43_18070 [Prevotella sp.]|jgi:hypothetical protein|nr:hypothetical protein [Prevotella sp.]
MYERWIIFKRGGSGWQWLAQAKHSFNPLRASNFALSEYDDALSLDFQIGKN